MAIKIQPIDYKEFDVKFNLNPDYRILPYTPPYNPPPVFQYEDWRKKDYEYDKENDVVIVPCKFCNGTGEEPTVGLSPCEGCHGAGVHRL